MLIFISGGVRSGKSALGEKLAAQFASGRKVYLATSEVCDDEMEARVARHRADRAGKGFVTIERCRDIGSASALVEKGDAVLLDCLGALAANEMFAGGPADFDEGFKQALAGRIFGGIMEIQRAASALVVISNEVFSDGASYEKETADYIDVLGRLHGQLAKAADAAVECACGMHIVHKGGIAV
jgi:adenosylcobinamide kinase/adenosylcobinamide-phosphate guanylyltransferase